MAGHEDGPQRKYLPGAAENRRRRIVAARRLFRPTSAFSRHCR